MEANGLHPRQETAAALPTGVKYVVLIVKESRAYDEVFGDILRVSNGSVMGAPAMARFGATGYVAGDRCRLSLQRVDVTPNHHAMALGWSFSDNFYADSEESVDGHHWLVGVLSGCLDRDFVPRFLRRWEGFPLCDDRARTAELRRKRFFGASRGAARRRNHLASPDAPWHPVPQLRRRIRVGRRG